MFVLVQIIEIVRGRPEFFNVGAEADVAKLDAGKSGGGESLYYRTSGQFTGRAAPHGIR
jgi:hypothetical protein